jgi:AraC-like DNA-binding protein
MAPGATAQPVRFDSTAAAASLRSRYWHDVIAHTYFPLDMEFRHPDQFNGWLSLWDLGELSLTRNACDALLYRRRPHHFSRQVDEDFLVTVPTMSDVDFSQCGMSMRCRPGQFVLERSHEPYEFSHDRTNDLHVLKVPARILNSRIRSPGRFCALPFDATRGIGSLLADMLRLIPERFDTLSPAARTLLGQQLSELLALALSEDDRVLGSSLSCVRDAHLARIESYVRRHLFDTDLDPERVAAASGISVRYMHRLFHETGQTLGRWVRERRLEAARAALSDVANRRTLGEVALRCGLGDQAQFSRLFKAQFGQTPGEFRRQARERRSSLS